jgi:hypothetical protein
MKDQSPILKVYGSQFWHDDVVIIGNRTALTSLRDAIDRALHSPETQQAKALEADGEGYTVEVKQADFPFDDPFWNTLPLHYSNPDFNRTGGVKEWRNLSSSLKKEEKPRLKIGRILFFLPFLLVPFFGLFSLAMYLLRQPSDIAVYSGVLLICLFIGALGSLLYHLKTLKN